MSQQIASDLTANSAALTLLDAPNAQPASLPFRLKPLPQLGERELSLRVQQILAPPSHGRRKIWDFDGNLHCSIIGTRLTAVLARRSRPVPLPAPRIDNRCRPAFSSSRRSACSP
jgi:hypothetical protein